MRVTLLSWRDTSHPDGGGSERYLEEIAVRLAAGGDTVTIICAAHPNAPRDETRNGVRFRRRGGRLTVYLHGLAFLLSSAGRRQDVVVDVVNGIPFAAGLIRRRGVVVLVHHVHRAQWKMIYPGLRGRIGWFIESRAAPRLYRRTPHVTVSESTRRDLAALGVSPDRVAIVRNGVSVPAVAATRSATPRLCVLGRLVPHKQVEHALYAVAHLADEFPGLHLDVIGDGWWREQLIRTCAGLAVEDKVTFHGRVTATCRDALLGRAWLMLAPSAKEGWGIAIVDAAVMGTPTVAYHGAGGTEDSVVDGVTGILATDRADLVRATAGLLRSAAERERMGEAARRRALLFNWSETAAEFRSVLENAARVSGSRTGRSDPSRGCSPAH